MIDLDAHPGPSNAAAIRATTRLFVSQLATKGRLITLSALGMTVVLLGLVARGANEPLDVSAHIIADLGLGIVIPITTLVLASATIGEMRADGTLVYLWLRPVPHWATAVGASLSTLVIAIPLAVLPVMASAALAGEWGLALPAAGAAALAVVGYTGVFVTLGAWVDRAFLIGLGYILIWEDLVARFGTAFSRLSILGYATSFLEHAADVDLTDLTVKSMGTTIIVPIVVLLIGIGLTSRLLARREID